MHLLHSPFVVEIEDRGRGRQGHLVHQRHVGVEFGLDVRWNAGQGL